MAQTANIGGSGRPLRAIQTAHRPGEIYHLETLRPIVCLIFVTPILLIYELGVVFSESIQMRTGLDTGFQWLLGWLGMGHLLLLPLITIFVLLAMHHCRRDRPGLRVTTLGGMVIESTGLGLILLCAAKAHHLWFLEYSDDLFMSVAGNPAVDSSDVYSGWEQFVSFCGAGLYEELVFRLLLLTGLVMGLRRIGIPRLTAIVTAVLLTSLLFAAAHYQIVNPAGAPFDVPGFAVRTVVSLVFCAVFLLRGFGIAVGTHIAYDLAAQW